LEKEKLAQLVEDHGEMVYATAYRLVGCAEDAEDVLQEVFLKILARESSRQLPQTSSQWGAYLRVAATNCALSLLKKRQNKLSISLEILGDVQDPSGGTPRTSAIDQQRAHLFRRSLASLPKRDARIFSLRHLEELPYEEIARQLKVSVNHVGVLLSRARKLLQKNLALRDSSQGDSEIQPIDQKEIPHVTK
jgi:RNA polymerase sigma-70 factor, ECF subfamily